MSKNTIKVFLAILCLPSLAFAAPDMWTEMFVSQGLFIPHTNICNSTTEVFVPIGETANQGFCIEKNERSAETFEDARQDCAADGKRLPELVEFKYACIHATGLNDMTNNHEWASNFVDSITLGSAGGASVPVAGDSGCAVGSLWQVTWNGSPYESSAAYRCVR